LLCSAEHRAAAATPLHHLPTLAEHRRSSAGLLGVFPEVAAPISTTIAPNFRQDLVAGEKLRPLDFSPPVVPDPS